MALSTSFEDCTGCSACASACPMQCIEMKPDEYGFLRPHISSKNECINCGRCDAICPIINKPISMLGFRAIAAYSNDALIRSSSSSGGLFSEISRLVLDLGGVVYGAAYTEDFSVAHLRIENEVDLIKCRGAKYVQSKIGHAFESVKEDLNCGTLVLFSGTPCQVNGLYSFLGKHYDNLICIDFICHGISSPTAWKEYISFRNNKSKPIYVNMRSKDTGWSKYRYSLVIKYEDGTIYSSRSDLDLFLRLFVGNYINNSACVNCSFRGLRRCSDITLADFWGVWDLHPEMDDDKGTSALIIHTKRGEILLNNCKNRITMKEIPIGEVDKYNPSLTTSSTANPNRIIALSMAVNGQYNEIESRYFHQNILVKFKRIARSCYYKLSLWVDNH